MVAGVPERCGIERTDRGWLSMPPLPKRTLLAGPVDGTGWDAAAGRPTGYCSERRCFGKSCPSLAFQQ